MFETDEIQNLEHLQILKRSLDQIESRLQQKLQMLNRKYRSGTGVVSDISTLTLSTNRFPIFLREISFLIRHN